MGTSCAIGKLGNPKPTDTCEAWELDENAAKDHEERSADEFNSQDALCHGFD